MVVRRRRGRRRGRGRRYGAGRTLMAHGQLATWFQGESCRKRKQKTKQNKSRSAVGFRLSKSARNDDTDDIFLFFSTSGIDFFLFVFRWLGWAVPLNSIVLFLLVFFFN